MVKYLWTFPRVEFLPFFPSPCRDDGYDIADYCAIHPSYGTLDDFRRFLDTNDECTSSTKRDRPAGLRGVDSTNAHHRLLADLIAWRFEPPHPEA